MTLGRSSPSLGTLYGETVQTPCRAPYRFLRVRIDTAKAIGKFLSRSGKSDSESKVTISLEDEDFAKKLEEVASDSAGKQMLEFAIAMYEKNNSGN